MISLGDTQINAYAEILRQQTAGNSLAYLCEKSKGFELHRISSDYPCGAVIAKIKEPTGEETITAIFKDGRHVRCETATQIKHSHCPFGRPHYTLPGVVYIYQDNNLITPILYVPFPWEVLPSDRASLLRFVYGGTLPSVYWLTCVMLEMQMWCEYLDINELTVFMRHVICAIISSQICLAGRPFMCPRAVPSIGPVLSNYLVGLIPRRHCIRMLLAGMITMITKKTVLPDLPMPAKQIYAEYGIYYVYVTGFEIVATTCTARANILQVIAVPQKSLTELIEGTIYAIVCDWARRR